MSSEIVNVCRTARERSAILAGSEHSSGQRMSDGSGNPPVTLVVVDDHELIVDALDRSLRTHPRLRVIGSAGDIATGLDVVSTYQPDIVVLDVNLPDGSGVDAITALRRLAPGAEVVILTGFADSALLARALEAGCAGFVSKGNRLDELIAAIEAVAAGQVSVPPDLLDGLVAHLRPQTVQLGHDLTVREREILELLAAGRSTTDMVAELVLSVHTVRNHVRNVLQKLNASSRLEAVAVATRAGLLAGR
jgi:DNA-binding NarL/FixJ family response regulator